MAPSRKRKLKDLTADEFLDGGFALAGSDGGTPAPQPGPAPPAGRARSEAAQHKAQLAALQQQDPEFYAYLQQTDNELLQFGEGSEDESSADIAGGVAPAAVAAEASQGNDTQEEAHAGQQGRGDAEKEEAHEAAGGAPPTPLLRASAPLGVDWPPDGGCVLRQGQSASHCGADRQVVPRRQGNVLVQGHAQPAEGATRCPRVEAVAAPC